MEDFRVDAGRGQHLPDHGARAAHLKQDYAHQRDRAKHGHRKLEEIRDHHAPISRERCVQECQDDEDGHGRDLVPTHNDVENLAHGQRNPANDDTVDKQAVVDGAKRAERCRGPAFVAQFHELDIGEQTRATPEPSEKVDGEHPAHEDAPP